jgi:hypothetical protein
VSARQLESAGIREGIRCRLDGGRFYCTKIYDKVLFQEIEADSEIQSEESAEEPFVSEEQRLKNRYLNIGAVERTRVRIHSLDGTADAYVNANYIDVRTYPSNGLRVYYSRTCIMPYCWPAARASKINPFHLHN